jgi:hypothetical protein
LDFVETFANRAYVEVVSCRTDLFPFYEHRGYISTKTLPIDLFIPKYVLTRDDLEMVIMQKK